MTNLAVFLALPLFGLSHGAPATPAVSFQAEPGRYVKTIQVGDTERSYIVRVPKQYDGKTKLPLVMLFHGWETSAAQAERYTLFAQNLSGTNLCTMH